MKNLAFLTILLSLGSVCTALPPTRAPPRIKQSTSSDLGATPAPLTSVTAATVLEERTKNTNDQTTSSSSSSFFSTSSSSSSSSPVTYEEKALQTKKISIAQETTTSPQQPQTTSPSLAKETRETTGKNRPQIKITTNYTSIAEDSTNGAKELFEWNRRVFDFMGAWPLEISYGKFAFWVIYLLIHTGMLLADLVLVFGNLRLMVLNLTETMLQIMVLAKLGVMRFSQTLVVIMEQMKREVNETVFDNNEERQRYTNYNRIAKRCFKLWLTMGTITLLVYHLKPLEFRLRAHTPVLVASLVYGATLLFFVYGYCIAGEYLVMESENLYEAYYLSQWCDSSASFRKNMIICMIASKRPILLTGGGFYIFSLVNFTGILKTAAGYISMLRTMTSVRLPEGASAALAKPTKYHYYPHNQHIYLLPECAVQQVCNAVYVRLNFTQPLCACPGRYRDPCSASLDSDDLHTTELVTDPRTKALTLVKTCEPVAEMRECRAPRDWSLLALQNVRTGKSHYLVICRCPDTNILEGPMSHDQPTYASVPGIRVYGMMCVQGNRRGRPLRHARNLLGLEDMDNDIMSSFPWHRVPELMNSATWD